MNSVNEKRIEGIMEKGDYKMNREYYENLLDDDFRIVAIDVFEDNDLMPTGFKWNDNLQLLISDNDYDMDNDKYKIAIEVQEVTLSNEKKYIILRLCLELLKMVDLGLDICGQLWLSMIMNGKSLSIHRMLN